MLVLCAFELSAGQASEPTLMLPARQIEPRQVAVVANRRDPLSMAIARYYRDRRGIPPANLVEVDLDPDRTSVSSKEFMAVQAALERQLPSGIRALALTWTRPFRVDCMSITAAFTFGFDRRWCSESLCSPTARSPLFGRPPASPDEDPTIRPSMLIAATNLHDARALIDRGIAADGSWPDATAYLVRTTDSRRNVRALGYEKTASVLGPYFNIEISDVDRLDVASDALFYFTGLAKVPGLDSIDFVPGAMADHLTSAGGRLPGREHDQNAAVQAVDTLSDIVRQATGNTEQMSAIEWLRAGATGSYGTVVEPCNLPGKFPHPGLAIHRYLSGGTLLEAYWHSVAMPGEGVFLGEPLARPFGGYRLRTSADWIVVETHVLPRGAYRVEAADDVGGPFVDTGLVVTAGGSPSRFGFPNLQYEVYRLVSLPVGQADRAARDSVQ